ncbi:TraB/GumN family protein [Segetibacter sp. 3557_3]|uniref:TraB/GumN family protein n=1 Tax=Segetibacter sp. 3557_3 TaxID=2547429 RepID=UPI0014054B9D|nr:TraB/GumN family protein [Segetibacter sp. 3557_3]
MKLSAAKVFSFLGLALFFSCRQKTNIPESPTSKTLLWEVTGNQLSSPAYFLGTMHMMCANEAVLSENVKAVIKGVDQIYLEVDMDDIAELMSGMTSLSMKEGTTLADLLTPQDYEKVKLFFETHQPAIPFKILERQQPLMTSSGLYELFLDCDQKNGIDLRIIDEASRLKKVTKGLETMAFQSSIFDSIPYQEQAKELVKLIDSIGKYKSAMNEMIGVYREQDIEKLHDLTTREESGVNSYLDLLLYDRNRNWVKQFRDIALNKKTLFAVGAGHLGGKQGVLNLLRQQGYAVRPLMN